MKKLIFSILLLVTSSTYGASDIQFKPDFFFGLASAANQVEDGLNDTWMKWADLGKIAAFNNQILPKEKLRFWTHPEIEINLAAQTGIEVYRLGIEWERIMPAPGVFDEASIKRYREIIKLIRAKKMKVMLTLWHHAVPNWIQDKGGWTNDETIKHFITFSERVISEYQGDVEWWITFNEGNVFASLAYSIGLWPPGEKRPPSAMFSFEPFYRGDSIKAMDRMSDSHNELYILSHKKYPNIKIGLAHNMAYYTSKTFTGKIIADMIDYFMNWRFVEKTRDHMDFFGFNYYGAEWIKNSQIDIDPEEEYSEAGRAVYPTGLYFILKKIHEKFKDLPIIITENGIGDSTDIIRPLYMIEHLKAVKKAQDEGMNILGYIVWTLSDNLEWSDGYCPKFGLVAVDRAHDLKRVPRGSFELFKEMNRTKTISVSMQEAAYKKLTDNFGKDRPFCRAQDGVTALDQPVNRAIVKKDWRFYP